MFDNVGSEVFNVLHCKVSSFHRGNIEGIQYSENIINNDLSKYNGNYCIDAIYLIFATKQVAR